MSFFLKKRFLLTLLLFTSSFLLVEATTFGTPSVPVSGPSPAEMIVSIYRFSLSIAGFLAFGIIVYAGLRYTWGGDAPSVRSEAREMITQAFLGIILLVGAAALFGIVNNNLNTLVDPQLRPAEAVFHEEDDTPPSGSGGPPPAAGCAQNSEGCSPEDCAEGTDCRLKAERLLQAGVEINRQCYDRTNSAVRRCTSTYKLPDHAINEVINLQRDACGSPASTARCHIVMTGGTEEGHKTHAIDRSIVDIRTNDAADRIIKERIGVSNPQYKVWYKDKGGYRVAFYYYEGDHWHICFDGADCPHARDLAAN